MDEIRDKLDDVARAVWEEALQDARQMAARLRQKTNDKTLSPEIRAMYDRVLAAYSWITVGLEERRAGGSTVNEETTLLCLVGRLLIESSELINEGLLCNM